jgi:hypothetical protein
MPYTSGETPEVGDYVKNKWEQPGTVTAVHAPTSGYEQVSIRWDDLPAISAAEFTLLARSSGVSRGLDPPAISSGGSKSEKRVLQGDGSVSRADPQFSTVWCRR